MAAIQSRLATAYPADNRGWTRVEFVSLFEEELPVRCGAARAGFARRGGRCRLASCVCQRRDMTLVRQRGDRGSSRSVAALGAGRGRVARLLLTEAILLSAGAGLGLLFAWVATASASDSPGGVAPSQ